MNIIPHEQIGKADLIVDAIYEGGTSSSVVADALSKLLPGVGNQGGFRASGRGEDKRFAVLYTSGEDKDWPDTIDANTGKFTYFGDNKTPGHELHDTRRGGNRLLRRVFELLHSSRHDRGRIPPFLVFAKFPTPQSGRSVQFKGLAVPGFYGMPPTEDLVAVWKTSGGQRFQNYRATFTILDVPVVKREWISSLLEESNDQTHLPQPLQSWITHGKYTALTSEPTTTIRTVAEQTPDTDVKAEILRTIFTYFQDSPFLFEAFSARLFQMFDSRVIIDQVTRNVVDGGRDAIGRLILGLSTDPVYVDFALEAKCYCPGLSDASPNLVGVREVARLISRLRHRQFGVLVTTSAIARQAYQEVREDRHPIVFLSGGDIANILVDAGYNTPALVRELLEAEFARLHSPMQQEAL